MFFVAFLIWGLLYTSAVQRFILNASCWYLKENYHIEILPQGFEQRTWTRLHVAALQITFPDGDTAQLKKIDIDLVDHFFGIKNASIQQIKIKSHQENADFDFFPLYERIKPLIAAWYGFSSYLHNATIHDVLIDESPSFSIQYIKDGDARSVIVKHKEGIINLCLHPKGDTYTLALNTALNTPYEIWKDRLSVSSIKGDISLNPKKNQLHYQLNPHLNGTEFTASGNILILENGFQIQESSFEEKERRLILKGCIDCKNRLANLLLNVLIDTSSAQQLQVTAHTEWDNNQFSVHLDMDRSDFNNTAWHIISLERPTFDFTYNNAEWDLKFNFLRDNLLQIQLKNNTCTAKMQKKGQRAFFDKIDVAYDLHKKKLKGIIDIVGENVVRIDQTFENNKMNGNIFINLKDFAPLSTPFDLATVGRIKGNFIFENFSLLDQTGKILIDLHSKFFRTPYVKVDMTTLKGTVWGNTDADILFSSKDFTLGKYLLFLGKGFMAEKLQSHLVGKNGIYRLNTKAHAHKIGYLSSDVNVNIDVEFNKSTQCFSINTFDFLHLKQHLILQKGVKIYLSPFKIIDDLHITINDKNLHLKNVSRNNNWTGTLTFTDLDMNILSWIFYKTIITGTATGSLQLSGSGTIPDFKGSFTGIGVQWGQFSESLQSISDKINVNLHAEKDGGRFSYDGKIKSEKRVDLIFSGLMNLEKKYCEKSVLKGHIDMSLISALFATGDRLCGDIELNLALKGGFDSPIWQGYIQANNLYVELSEFGTVISRINGKITTHGNRWTVHSLQATDTPLIATNVKNPGTVNISGNIVFDHLLHPKVDLKARVDNYLIVDMDAIVSRASGDLTIKGDGIFSTIKGLVDIQKLTVDIDRLHTEDGIPEIKLKDPKKRSYAKEYQAERMSLNAPPLFPLDLTLRMNNKFFMSGSILSESLWGGDIKVLGPINKACLDGTLYIQNGQIDFFGKVMKIEKGNLIFQKTERNEPKLSLEASRKVGDISIILKINTDQNPIVQFDSSPSMSTDEILAWLLFGKSAGSVSAGQSIQLAAALAKLQGQKAFNLMDDFRKGIGLDTFEFREQSTRSTSNFDTASNQVLHVGKKLTDSLEVTVEQGTTQGTSRVALEMDVGHNISVNSGVSRESDPSKPDDTKSNFSLGLSWNNRY